MQLLFKRRLPGKKYIRLKAAGAGEMNKSEFSSLALRDLQQRQGNSFSPRGQISRSRAGFIQAAYDITCALIDRLPPAVLLDLPVLILPQELRKRFRHSMHGKLGGQCAS